MEFEPSQPTPSTQELRLATTMTGGVSLAIWMAGVAREINLLAQASQWRRQGGTFPGGLTEASADSLKLYAQLIDLLDTVVEVDVLSGTSAGGIGAALLASSRVTGSDLGGLRDIWLDLGALTDLLRDPTDKNTPSLLYGDERMFKELAEEIPKLATGPFPPKGDDRPSTTLYVTTTLLTGETSRFTDSYGTLVQDVDRRGLFTFTEKELAKKDTGNALALAARSSASFPLAFEPSFVPFKQGTAKSKGVPARPAMAHFANITCAHWAADGGLLDNQPIDVLLQRVFDRRAQKPVRRVLLFVVPSAGPAPDLVQKAPPDNVNEPLGLVDGLLKDLAAVTTQSIAADLRAIRSHQDRMEARTDNKLHLAELAASTGSRLLTTSLLADYGKREATKHAQALTSALLRQLSTWPPASSGSTESIPEQWESELAIGGDAEILCRRQITKVLEERWSRLPLPQGPADFARYDQPAYDLAKGCAVAVIEAAHRVAVARAAYQLENSTETNIKECTDKMTVLAQLTADIHGACKPPGPIDLGELVHEVCTKNEVRDGSLENAADVLARDYLDRSTVAVGAWESLGQAVADSYGELTQLADDVLSASAPRQGSPIAQHQQDQVAASQLKTYLTYLLSPGNNRRIMARKLFDLAVTQRAMLPAEADVEQSVELVQVSADTRSLLAPDWQTAQDKLTGMQLHHFGAFYKRSWRANDWMWGRLDGAGWLVHIVLDPRRVRWIVQTHTDELDINEDNRGARWFLRKLKALGAPDFSSADDAPPGVTEKMLVDELAFLDDRRETIPPSIPLTALWLAQAWQRRVLDEELEGLAKTVLDPEPGKKPDWSPTKSRSWAERVLAAKRPAKEPAADQPEGPDADEYYKLLNENPVAEETFASDKGSPLMAQTITKAAATASAAVGSVRQMPGVLKPPVITVRTLALGGYRVVSLTKGIAKRSIIAGAVFLVLGIAVAIQSALEVGAWGLIAAGIGGYLIVLGTWQLSSRALFALLSFTLVLAVFALTTCGVRTWLFGTKDRPGLVGTHIYWLGTQWWHPLIVVGAIALALTLVAAANPRRRWRGLRHRHMGQPL
jgi:patatin-related protein